MTDHKPFLFVLAILAVLVLGATKDDDTPSGRLLASCMTPEGSVSAAKSALDEGADINAQDDKSGQTPLMAATLRGKTDLVQFLLSKGADTSIAERSGYTPPHGAGFQGRSDVMALLVKEGLDVMHVHTDGFAPFHRACWGKEARHTETVRFLLEQGADVNQRGTGDMKKTCWEMTKNEGTKAVLREYGAIETTTQDEL